MQVHKKQSLRIVSGFLAASMALSVFPTAAFAASPAKTTASTAAVTQSEETSDKVITTLEFDDKGIPATPGGNEGDGWDYSNDFLTIYEGYKFSESKEVSCPVINNGTIEAGIFNEVVYNHGIISAGTFKAGFSNYAEITGGNFFNGGINDKGVIRAGTFEGSVSNRSEIAGGSFTYVSNDEHKDHDTFEPDGKKGTIDNADIGELNTMESTLVTNSVFRLSDFSSDVPAGAHALTFSEDAKATVNDVIKVDADHSKVYVVGNRPVTVTYTGDSEYFESWEVDPAVGTASDKTIRFDSLNSDVALSVKEKAMDLEFGENGLPTKRGNQESKWTYRDGVLTFYEGYVFNMAKQEVNCHVVNYGTIEAGSFKEYVENYGTINDGTFVDYINNKGTINGGIIANISSDPMPENTYTLVAAGCTINDEIENGAYIIGKGHQITVKVPDSNTDFESWKETDGITTEGMTSRTITFVMPEHKVELKANYTDNPLEFDANGLPTHRGGKNWELVPTGSRYALLLYDGAVLDTTETVKCAMVASYPGSTIKNGTFENSNILNFGTIENGVFEYGVQSGGTIKGGTFNTDVQNINLKMDRPMSDFGLPMDMEKTDCEGLIEGGTFNGNVENYGIISGGTFNDEVASLPFADLAEGRDLEYEGTTEIKGGTFKATVWNKCDITGGTFEGKVVNAGKIADGVFAKDVENTTEERLDQQMRPEAASASVESVAVYAMDDFAIELQNSTGTETSQKIGTIEGGTFEGKVLNYGVIEGGTYKAEVQNADKGVISGGIYKAEVKNTDNGEITGGEFETKVENNGKPITGGVFAERPTGTADDVKLYTLNVPEGSTIDGKAATHITSVKGKSFEVEYIGSNFTEWEITGAELDNAKANPVTITLGDSDVTLTLKKEESKPSTPGETEKPGETDKPSTPSEPSKPGETDKPSTPSEPSKPGETDKPSTPGETEKPGETDKPSTPGETEKPGETDKPSTPSEPEQSDSGAGALLVGGALVAGGVATGVIVYNVAMDVIKSALPEGAAIPETREQLAAALWEKAGKPEVAVEEGVVLTDTEKAMRWAIEKQLISAEGEDSVSKIDVLVAAYKANALSVNA